MIVERALSLTQPWASLVAIGAKRYETRSWGTAYRGWIAIHAAKGFPKDCQSLCYQERFARALSCAGFNMPKDLPRGEVIAIARLADCIGTDRWTPASDTDEYAFGNYGPCRVAWELQQVHAVTPFAAKGALGLWRLPAPLHADQLTKVYA